MNNQIIKKHNLNDFDLLIIKMILFENLFHNKIMKKNVFLEINNKNIASFFNFENLLNKIIENVIKIRVKRFQNNYNLKMKMQNFSQFTSYQIFQFVDFIFHDIRYHIIFRYNIFIKNVIFVEIENFFKLNDEN